MLCQKDSLDAKESSKEGTETYMRQETYKKQIVKCKYKSNQINKTLNVTRSNNPKIEIAEQIRK